MAVDWMHLVRLAASAFGTLLPSFGKRFARGEASAEARLPDQGFVAGTFTCRSALALGEKRVIPHLFTEGDELGPIDG